MSTTIDDFYEQLQKLFTQAVESTTHPDWLAENSYILSDLWDREGEFEVERFAQEAAVQKVYARIGTKYTSAHDMHRVIYQILGSLIEDFFVLVPLHTFEAWQYGFITGSKSHGHMLTFVIERKTHPHIQE